MDFGMDNKALTHFAEVVAEIRVQGTYKSERVLITPQSARIDTTMVDGA